MSFPRIRRLVGAISKADHANWIHTGPGHWTHAETIVFLLFLCTFYDSRRFAMSPNIVSHLSHLMHNVYRCCFIASNTRNTSVPLSPLGHAVFNRMTWIPCRYQLLSWLMPVTSLSVQNTLPGPWQPQILILTPPQYCFVLKRRLHVRHTSDVYVFFEPQKAWTTSSRSYNSLNILWKG